MLFRSNYYDTLNYYHAGARDYANQHVDTIRGYTSYFQPGTQRFDSVFALITSRRSNHGSNTSGSRFFDKSALYHVQGEYQLSIRGLSSSRIGGSYRMYRPNSDGTIFSDTAGRKISNSEFGIYFGADKKIKEKFTISGTLRLDKNINFDPLLSPAASLVYTPNKNHVLRFSISAAIRNPTLTDQYLYYNVGRAVLIGNTTGYDSLLTTASVESFFNNGKQPKDRKSTRLNSSHVSESRMPSSA